MPGTSLGEARREMSVGEAQPEMSVGEAQREMRSTFLNGSVGQAVSGAIWLGSAAAGTFLGVRAAILVLVLGGMAIFPLTQAVLRLSGRPANVDSTNPLRGLAMQVAFTVPLSLPLVGAAALHEINWLYPAFMIVVGAHYLPFMFLYGMRAFGALAALLLGGGYWLGLRFQDAFTIGGWATGLVLMVFAAWALFAYRQERKVVPGLAG